MVPKKQLEAMYEEAVREPYSFLCIYLLKQRDAMFHVRFEKRFQLDGKPPVGDGEQAAGEQHVLPK